MTVENPGRVERRLEALMKRKQRRRKRVERSHGLVGRSNEGRVTAVFLGPRSQALCVFVGRRAYPAQRASPFDHLFAAKIDVGCGRAHRQPPQGRAACDLEESMLLLAYRAPEHGSVFRFLATEAILRGADGAGGT